MLAERLSPSKPLNEPLDIIGSGGMPMAGGVSRRRFTSAEYHAMAEAGILSEDERVELIAGEIVEMAPIGSRHAGCVKRLNKRLMRGLGDRALVSVQDPITLGAPHEPEPDLAILRPREDDYTRSHPIPAEIFLVIEVADFSLSYDRLVKIPLYAEAGILEVWLVNLVEGVIEVYLDPFETAYRKTRVLRSGEHLAPRAFPDLELTVESILG
jgi:Uma2 family endonuclease